MHKPSPLQDGLSPNLKALLCGAYTRQQMNGVVHIVHALANAFLASKRSNGTLATLHGLNTSDIAYDCIAEIFQQDEQGTLVQLRAYFGSVAFDSLTDEELLAHLRRLVFSKVNHGVFRLYNESDPSLSRILRNTKLAIASLGQFVEVDRFGEPCIAPAMCETLEHLPPMEKDHIETHLLTVARGNESVPDLLAKLAVCLRDQTEYCRLVPLVVVAYALRTVYQSKQRSAGEAAPSDGVMLEDDIVKVVQSVSRQVHAQFKEKYVKKLQPEVFALYMNAIEQALVDRFVNGNGEDTSLYERMAALLPGLTKEDYKKYHRSRVEYMSRQAHDLAITELKKEHG
ncbi:MAG: hypothetical protein ACKVRP_14755 [Bacteroidota bacterium]